VNTWLLDCLHRQASNTIFTQSTADLHGDTQKGLSQSLFLIAQGSVPYEVRSNVLSIGRWIVDFYSFCGLEYHGQRGLRGQGDRPRVGALNSRSAFRC